MIARPHSRRLRAALGPACAALGPACAASLALSPSPALAQDGAYRRLDGDLSLSLEGGASLGDGARPVAQTRAFYLATAGLYSTASLRDSRLWFSSGVELRPLFLARFLNALEKGPSFADLLLDSAFFGFGVSFPGTSKAGFELGTGLELPLSGRFDGFYLGARFYHSYPNARLSGALAEGSSQAFLTLGFRGVFEGHIADAGDIFRR